MNNNNGTFVAVKFREDSKEALAKYASDSGIPNPLSPDEYHSTIVYSRNPLAVEKQTVFDAHWIGKPIGFDVFQSSWDDGSKTNCLVLKYLCVEMDTRHEYLKSLGATHDFPTYNAHITLSYDIGDYDISTLQSIETVLPEIYIVQEYSEVLKNVSRRKESVR
jgi:hypothetical protein